jgi:uncharacterized protein (DUF697 family)
MNRTDFLGDRMTKALHLSKIAATPSSAVDKLTEGLMDLVMWVPTSTEVVVDDPHARSLALLHKAAKKSAGISGTAALVPGPLGMLTLIPDLLAIWSVQAQLVADIAAIHGKTGTLSKEQMIWCMFKHSMAHFGSDLVVQAGERFIVRKQTVQFIQKIIGKLGVKIAKRLLSKTVARYLPLVGAAAVAQYAYVDTKQVGLAAMTLFSKQITIQ